MVIRWLRFNSYLLAAALTLALSGCETTKSAMGKQLAMIRVHIEVPRDDLGQSLSITVSRATPIALHVSRSPFLDDSNLTQASLVETHGSFGLVLQFDQRGAWLLEQYTAQNPGRHLAIAAKFGGKLEETRWLAAPLITRRIADGSLTFSPDASREEAEAIVRGLNNAADKDGRQPKSKDKAASK